jgi:thiol-disulfide isomerase/thioredoxin
MFLMLFLRVFLLVASMMLVHVPAVAASDFNLVSLDGKTYKRSDFRGQWLLVNFWATWCPPCLEEIPDFIMLDENWKNLAVIGIAVDYESEQEVRRFVDENLISYPIVLGDDKIVRHFGPAAILPTTYIYDPQGTLVKTQRGLIKRQQIERLVSGRN